MGKHFFASEITYFHISSCYRTPRSFLERAGDQMQRFVLIFYNIVHNKFNNNNNNVFLYNAQTRVIPF